MVALVEVVGVEEIEKVENAYDYAQLKMVMANHYVVVVPKQPGEKIPVAVLPYDEVVNVA